MFSCCTASKFAYDIIEPRIQGDVPLMSGEQPYLQDYRFPKKADMALCIVMFNPSKSKRMIMNYFFMLEKLRLAKMPVFTLELTFGNASPEIKDAYHVRADSYLFHKERLCRLLEKRVPPSYSKICFLDGDILFENSNWYNETSGLLDRYQVVQPFETACWLDLTYKNITLKRQSVVYMNRSTKFDSNYHPGFAWAFQRSWYNKIGFYDLGISGSGDTMSAGAWLGVEFPATAIKNAYTASYAEFKKKLVVLPKIASTSGSLYHLWHGNRINRKYVSRHECLNHVGDVRDILAVNSCGVYELMDRKVNNDMKTYFDEREDDGLS